MEARTIFSFAETIALGLMYREVFQHAKELEEDSECGERLRNIAQCLLEWQSEVDEVKAKYPADAEMLLLRRKRIERGALARVSWLLVGKTPEEILSMVEGDTQDRPAPVDWHILDGGNEAKGFYVSGDSPTDSMLHVYGPYGTLEDAEAVVSAKDSTVRRVRDDLDPI